MSSRIHSSRMLQEQRKRLHPDFLANEDAYWNSRETLIREYHGKWIAYDRDRGVIASAENFWDMGNMAREMRGHPYVVWVGKEDTFVVKMRRSFSYDTSYSPTALPRANVTFSNVDRSDSQTYPDVIPDTGADLSSLIEEDVLDLRLDTAPSIPIQTVGITGHVVATTLYPGYASINGSEYRCFFQILPGLDRILGRDVLNQIRVVFDGPNNQVEFDIH